MKRAMPLKSLLFIVLSCIYCAGCANASKEESWTKQDESLSCLPTDVEISTMKSQLPVIRGGGVEIFGVNYEDLVLTIEYRFLIDFEEELIEDMKTPEYADYMKDMMVAKMIKDKDKTYHRVKACMTFRSVYYSKNKEKLYQIDINRSDLE